MSFWQKLLNADQQYNEHKNQTSCVENDCSCKSNEQLLEALVKATDEDVIKGIKKVLFVCILYTLSRLYIGGI